MPAKSSTPGLEERRDLAAGEPRQEDGAQKPRRNADQDGAGGHVDAAHDHREDAVDIVGGTPRSAEKKLGKADLRDGRHAVREEKDADESHREDDIPAAATNSAFAMPSLMCRWNMYTPWSGYVSERQRGGCIGRLAASELFRRLLSDGITSSHVVSSPV